MLFSARWRYSQKKTCLANSLLPFMHLSIREDSPWVGFQSSKCSNIRWAANFSLRIRLRMGRITWKQHRCFQFPVSSIEFCWLALLTGVAIGILYNSRLMCRWKIPCPSTSTANVFAHLRDQRIADLPTSLKYLQGFRSKARREYPARAALMCQVCHEVTLPWRSRSYAIIVFTWHLTWTQKTCAANTTNKMSCSIFNWKHSFVFFRF